jgi:SAM-dependent methyltransferase
MGKQEWHLRAWFRHPLGRQITEQLQVELKPILSELKFGYHFLQCGGLAQYLSLSAIPHRIKLDYLSVSTDKTSIYGEFERLPFKPDSIDVISLPHSLEVAADPHQVLREVWQCLIPGGHVVIIGFNPWSLWGVWRLFVKKRHIFPVQQQWISLLHLRQCLWDLNYEITATQHCLFNTPWTKPGSCWQALLKKCWPSLGGIMIVVAKKKVITLTPLKPAWILPKLSIAHEVAKPSARTRPSP